MPQKKPDFNKVLPEGDQLTPEEQAAAEAEERGVELVEQPEESAAPEKPEQADTSVKPKGKQKDSEFVPRTRLNEVAQEREAARQEVQRIAQENATLRENWARLEERQRMATEAQQRAQQAEQEMQRRAQRPDPDVDPQGATLWDTQQALAAVQAQNQQLMQTVEQRTQQFTGAFQQNQMAQFAQMQANVGRQKYPDYDARVDFARDQRKRLWMSVGYPEQQATAIVQNEEVALLAQAMQTGAPLADRVVEMTNLWGYQAPQATNGNGTQNGGLKLSQIQNGQRVQGLGRTQSAEMPAQQAWQTMNDAEFAQYIVGLQDGQYMDMIKDKAFARKVNELDLKGAA